MYFEDPSTPAWGLCGPRDLPVSWGFEKGVVRVSDATADRQAELYQEAVAMDAVRTSPADTVPDFVPDMDTLKEAPVSPAPVNAGSLALSKAVEIAEVQHALV